MNITIDMRDIDQLRKELAGFSDRRFQSGLAEALNGAARAVADEWGGQLYTRIDRPTAPTRNAAMVVRADVGRLQAEVKLKDTIGNGSGTAPDEYLRPQEFGGDRTLKKFERALQAKGAMPLGYKVVPGKHARLDGYGNISRGQIVQVLNQLGSNLSGGYRRVISANEGVRKAAARRSGRVYVAIPKPVNGLQAGVYERAKGQMLPVFFFVSRTKYGKRLELVEHGLIVAQQQLGRLVIAAMQRRVASLMARGQAV